MWLINAFRAIALPLAIVLLRSDGGTRTPASRLDATSGCRIGCDLQHNI
jgi:hypothetical protein